MKTHRAQPVPVQFEYGITYPVKVASILHNFWIPLFAVVCSTGAFWQLLQALKTSGRLGAFSDGWIVLVAFGYIALIGISIVGLNRLFNIRDELTVTHRALVFRKRGVITYPNITYCEVRSFNIYRPSRMVIWFRLRGQSSKRLMIPVQPIGSGQPISELSFSLFIHEAVLCGQGLLKKSDMYAMKMQ